MFGNMLLRAGSELIMLGGRRSVQQQLSVIAVGSNGCANPVSAVGSGPFYGGTNHYRRKPSLLYGQRCNEFFYNWMQKSAETYSGHQSRNIALR